MARLDNLDYEANGVTTNYEIVAEIAPLFNTTTAYAAGDTVIKDGHLYRFNTAHTAGAWIGTDADEITVGEELTSHGADITELKADLSYITGNTLIPVIAYNKYIDLSGTTADINVPSASGSGFRYSVAACEEGDMFTVSAEGGNSPRAWGFIDSSGNIISKADASVTVTDLVLKAPNDAAYLVINTKSDSKSFYGVLIKKVVTDLTHGAKALASSIDVIEELNGSYTPSYVGSYKAYTKVLTSGRKYLMILTGTNVVGKTTMQLLKNGSWTGTADKKSFPSGYYRVFEPTTDGCVPAFYATETGSTIAYSSQLYDVTDIVINAEVVETIYQFSLNPVSSFEIVTKLDAALNDNLWYGKNVLAIGDSLTAGGQWITSFVSVLGSIVYKHAKGGLGMIPLVNGENGIDGDYSDTTLLKPLSIDDVTGKDLIIFYAGYNERGKPDGEIGDVYNPSDGTGNTIAGLLQYVINRIYEVLASANNLTCRVAIITPHCGGKYQYIDADGYTEYPSGSGRTMLTMANIMVDVANYNSLPCLNLWKTSGINKNTWTVFSASPTPTNPDGTGDVPYPQNRDQLHLSDTGYYYLGKRIADWVKGI